MNLCIQFLQTWKNERTPLIENKQIRSWSSLHGILPDKAENFLQISKITTHIPLTNPPLHTERPDTPFHTEISRKIRH